MFFKHKYFSFYYEKYGNSDKCILILPGWGNTRETFNYLIDNLKKNYTVYIIDYPSFGNSPIFYKDLVIDDYALVINEWLTSNNIKLYSIICHSFGGRVASLLLVKYKLNINKLVLMDVAGIKRKNIKLLFKNYLYKFLKKLSIFIPKKYKYNYLKKLISIFSSKDYQNIPRCMKTTFKNIINEDLRLFYKKIDVETLIIWGEKDKDTPLKDAFYLRKNISNSSLIIYKNANHFSYLEYPYLTKEIIINFFLL